jgi:hypothetical protein
MFVCDEGMSAAHAPVARRGWVALALPAMASASSFTLLGPATPQSPVLLAVPHAGRFYPDDVIAQIGRAHV